MKFSIDRDQLLEPLQLATSVVERKQTIPILANLLLEVSEDLLTVTGTDQEVELRTRLDTATIHSTGEATVPGRKLLDITRHLPAGSLMEFSLEDGRMRVVSGEFDSTLATLPVVEFPTMDAVPPDVSFEVSVSAFRQLIEKTSFAMATQDVRYFFNGLLLECTASELRAVATNGQRLALSEMDNLTTGAAAARYIIPRKGVNEMLRLLGLAADGELSLKFSDNTLLAESESASMVTRLIDATYPDYGKAIPESGDKVVVVKREVLRDALVRAAILSNEVYKNVRLELVAGRLVIHANNPLQEQANERVAVDYEGEALEIGFNVNYLIETLGIMSGPEIQMVFSDANSACLLTDPDDINSRYVISPMML